MITLQDLLDDRTLLRVMKKAGSSRAECKAPEPCNCRECQFDRLGEEIERHPIGGLPISRIKSGT